MYVTTVLKERIVSTSLLAHIVQQEICCTVINLCIDWKLRRHRITSLKIIDTRSFQITEIQSESTLHISPLPSRLDYRNRTYKLICLCIEYLKTLNICTLFAHEYGYLDALWQVT